LGFDPEIVTTSAPAQKSAVERPPVEDPVDPFSIEAPSNPMDPFAKSRRKYQQENPNE
jgi:hypothetical protein